MPAMITVFSDEPLTIGDVSLRGEAAHHIRVRRGHADEELRLLDGRGRAALGRIRHTSKTEVQATIERVVETPKPVALDVIVPIADKDRMLLAAEKCVELQITGWRPVHFARSRSVMPRGEGVKFAERVKARMQSALEQSGGAWLPVIHVDTDIFDVVKSVPSNYQRFLCDQGGESLTRQVLNGPSAIAVGPEGGLEAREAAAAVDGGWVMTSLTTTTLRFETALIVGAAVIRAAQLSGRS